MSPGDSDSLRSIAEDISLGFQTLLERLDAQKKIEGDLRQQLSRAVEKFNSSTSNDTSDGAFSAWQDEIVKQISTRPSDMATEQAPNMPPEVLKAKEALIRLDPTMSPSTGPHKAITKTNTSIATPRKCPVAHKTPPPAYEEMERDFTTQGKPSSLECPYAIKTKNGAIDAESTHDPIAAEFHPDAFSTASLEEARTCGRCPIRFLDKHSPEELAEYFEKHKHELPRSHEICVKRYQKNESSIRQLDEKYGNIVSMIQGLGNKHKQYLPAPNDEQAASGVDVKSTGAVEKWADNVDGDANMADKDIEPDLDRRKSHFDKPLRGIRVGESPTRPWGIHVPADRARARSAVSSKPSEPASVKAELPEPASKPALIGVRTITPSIHTLSHATSRRSRTPNQVIFNGPVILGYTAEQAATFIQRLASGEVQAEGQAK